MTSPQARQTYGNRKTTTVTSGTHNTSTPDAGPTHARHHTHAKNA